MPGATKTPIAAGSIELGPIPFNLYASGEGGRLVLFCRSGFKITKRHLTVLGDSNRSFFVNSDEEDSYMDYASERLDQIVSDPKIQVSEKTKVVHGVGRRVVQKLLEDPRSGHALATSGRYVESITDLLMTSPMVINNLFAISSIDSYTFSHSVNSCALCLLIGEKLIGRKREELWNIGLGALLFDIGKTRVDKKILFKASSLTDKEVEEVRKHALYSYDIIRSQNLPEPVALMGRSHHERIDGSGYPDGLKGGDIHLWARIAAVIDVYDAITSDRVYKKMGTHLDALNEIAEQTDKFDGDIFNTLLDVVLHNERLIKDFHNKRLTPEQLEAIIGDGGEADE